MSENEKGPAMSEQDAEQLAKGIAAARFVTEQVTDQCAGFVNHLIANAKTVPGLDPLMATPVFMAAAMSGWAQAASAWFLTDAEPKWKAAGWTDENINKVRLIVTTTTEKFAGLAVEKLAEARERSVQRSGYAATTEQEQQP